MTCDQVRSRLSWLLDGELDSTEAAAVRAHAAGCGKCGALLAEMTGNDEEIRAALADAKPSQGFAGRVVAAAGRKRPSWRRVVAAVAASFFIALALASAYVNTRTADPLQVRVHGSQAFHADSMGALRVFVTDAVRVMPVAQASVHVFLAGSPVGDFVTNAAGSIDGFFRVPDLQDGRYPLKIVVDSPIGSETLEKTVTVQREYRLMVTTDKPMYQPGQSIQMRALALNAFTLKPRNGDIQFEIADSKGNTVFTRKSQLSEYGIASAELTLADELNLGTYRIAVTASGLRQERTVEVARYVLPKFGLELESGKESYRPGEPVRGTVRAKYFFGKPVQGKVQAKLGREVVTGALKEDGSWEFQAPAPGEGTASLEVTVTDTADHKESKSTVVIVSRESLKVALYPEGGAIVPGLANTYYVLVSTPDGRPAKADLKMRIDGQVQDLVTDALGVARLTSRGEVALERARDQAGNETREMSRHGGDRREFLIHLDQASYKGGETMTVKVVGKPASPVYVDLIKGGQLLLTKVVEKGSDVAIDLPPDLFGTVQVLAYTATEQAPMVRVAYVNLPEGLQIRPRPSKEVYRPGEEMPVDFEVVDKDGKPVQAALGLSVVDEALFGLVEAKIASEKAWLSVAPELIDTRGFLKADAQAIYQDRASNAQRFVSGNGRAEATPLVVQNNFAARYREVESFIVDANEVILNLFLIAVGLAGALLAVFLLVKMVQALAVAKFSGVTVLLAILLTVIFMVMMFGTFVVKSSYSPGEVAGKPEPTGRFRSAPRPAKEWLRAETSRPEAKPEPAPSPSVVPAPMPDPSPTPPKVDEAPSAPARIREYFPETLFWQPQLITDAQGRARLTLPAADSITSWRMLANAVSRNGALGYTQSNLRVFQEFFADIDFPVALTKGDRVHVPVAVYNYLKEAQTVAVRVQREPWFELLDEESKSLALKPGEVSVVYFGLKVKEHGRKSLLVHAEGKVKDAIRRSVEVMEKGREIPVTASDRVNGRRAFTVEIPDRAIDGASVLFVRMTPGMSDLVTGLEGMIRMPTGCFEQTLSSAYPNVALHQYLRESGQLTKETETRLQQMHSIAVQKILSFESSGGGFGWYPGREANLVLTAYGTMFLADLAKVYEYDRRVLDRTIAWLENRQDAGGTWTGHDHGSTWNRLSNSAIPSTAWVAWALKRAGRDDTRALGRAEEFLRRVDDDDAYSAALIANAFPNRINLDRLAKMAKDGRWTTKIQSWTRARDGAADLEATALAVIALANHAPAIADEGAAWILKQRDPWGAWGSTQPTVLALRALAATGGGAARDQVAAKLSVNGKEIPNAFVESDAAQSVDISPHLIKGSNQIVVESSRKVNVQVAGRYYVPWTSEDVIGGVEGLKFTVTYDRTEAKVGDTVTCTVTVAADAFAMMAEVAIPPGFTVDASGLEDLVRRRVIDKYTQTGRTMIFYLPGKGATFSYGLKPRYPVKIAVPRSVAYEYYTPDRRVIVPPQEFEVRGQ